MLLIQEDYSDTSIIKEYAPWWAQVAQVVENLPANTGDIRDVGLIPGLGQFQFNAVQELGFPMGFLANRVDYNTIASVSGKFSFGNLGVLP